MSDLETPPRVFVSYSHDSPEHKEQVRLFADFLRRDIGLDVQVDQWDDNQRRDWSAWAIEHLNTADYILIIASPDYKRRADGTAPPHEGRGAQFEATIIRDQLTRNLREATKRLLPVVLPGRSVDDIPTFLAPHSATHFTVDEFTAEGVDYLLTAITGVGDHPMPPRGTWRGRTPKSAVRANAPAGPPAGASAPAGVVAAPPRDRVRLAGDLPWLVAGAEVRHAGARINGVHYDHSVVLRPSDAAEALGFVEVDLAGAYRRLTTVIGVLDDAAEHFQIGHFRVYLDGRPQPERRASWGMPGAVEVDVSGVRHLRLEMYRPTTASAPLLPGVLATGGRSSRLPELAWGNPTLL
ncbi:TIR domain-containing protein [Actinokineospora sp. PR83]|uniref:SEFIR domain-containing protein n=1 Tax=Actinokineospora sp. PR83 TaxID=2884908 RepID=UPI001F34C0E9|nr:SEFIR domain-containing protein [Actinokineospora sp. PR83]MCG8914310.1 TIR domain-containing protein [Actinokineospora sp. PR83]